MLKDTVNQSDSLVTKRISMYDDLSVKLLSKFGEQLIRLIIEGVKDTDEIDKNLYKIGSPIIFVSAAEA